MPFQPSVKKQYPTTYKKNEWLQTPVGTHQIRFLDDTPYEVNVHYLNATYIKCLDNDCPICQNNRKIFKTNPTDYKKTKGYSSKSTRYCANVLDRTSVKICPSCSIENKKIGNTFASSCVCGAMLNTVKAQPLNKVKLWGWGVEKQDQLAGFYASNVDDDGTPISLVKYDFMLLVTPAANDRKTVTPVPQTNICDEVTYSKEDLFVLSSSVISLTSSELVEFQNGVPLKDLFNARKASTDPKSDEEVTDLSSDIDEQVKSLFNN